MRVHPLFRFGAPAFALLALALALPPGFADAQQVTGRVVLEGWAEPLPDAVVLLLDEHFTAVDSVRTARDGSFVVGIPGPGVYMLQPRRGETWGALSSPLELTGTEPVHDVVLEFPSALYRAALDCFVRDIREGTGVLAGVVFDPRTDTPLPGARVAIEWTGTGGSRQTVEVLASEAGRFVACAVPAGPSLTARVHTLGTASDAQSGITVQEGALARHDLPLDLGAIGARIRLVTDARERGGGPSDLAGRLLDAQTAQPIPGARVALNGRQGEQVTGPDGRFRFPDLSPGPYTIEVTHLGYGQQSDVVEVPPESDVTVEVRVAARAIELGEITVRSRREGLAARLAGASPARTLAGPKLEEARQRGAPLSQALYELPGMRLNYAPDPRGGGRPPVVCVEASRGRSTFGNAAGGGGCNMVEVFLDGAAVPRELAMELLSQGLEDYDRIEFLQPMEAMRWGMRANEAGALFLWTKRGVRSGR